MSVLFSPLRLGRYALNHRVVLSPMTRCRSIDNEPNDLQVGLFPKTRYYLNAAKYRQRTMLREPRKVVFLSLVTCSLLVCVASYILRGIEASPVSAEGRPSLNIPSIYKRSQIDNWKKTTDAVHKKGGIIFIQLWHVGRLSHSDLSPKGLPPASPSTIRQPGKVWTQDGEKEREVPRQVTESDIQDILNDFANGAKNAMEAGFDGVEIHGANGYLLDQFLNSTVNCTRNDHYGGPSVENRIRFPLEVTKAVVKAIGADRVGIRFSPYGTYEGMGDANPIETWTRIIKAVNPLNLAYLHLMAPQSGLGALDPFSAAYDGTIITAGNYSGQTAAEHIQAGTTHACAFGRPFIGNPDLVERLRLGRPLADSDHRFYYTQGPQGYTDYPTYEESLKK